MSTSLSSQSYASSSRELQQQTERRARRVWVSIVVAMLGFQILGGIATVYFAIGDPTVAITPDYHQSAINWDTTRRARQLTQQLGWQIETTAIVSAEQPDRRLVRVQVLSSSGKAVDGLRIAAQVYHHADGNSVHQLKLAPNTNGCYVASTTLVKPGIWQIKLRLEGEHGTAAYSREITVK